MDNILWYILGVTLLVVGFFVYSYYRMKNAPQVKRSEKIKVLTNKNFMAGTKKGIVAARSFVAGIESHGRSLRMAFGGFDGAIKVKG